jgi:Ca2+-binding RTX toxin-like protein
MRHRRLLACLASTVAMCATAPATALADVVSLDTIESTVGSPPTAKLFLQAGDELNNLTIYFTSPTQVMIQDNNTINVSGGCTQGADATAAVCNAKAPLEPPNIYLGGGRDVVSVRAAPGLRPGVEISLGGGDDVVHGGPGPETVYGGVGADAFYGEGGDDLLFGEGGPDRLLGGPGNDRLEGGPQNDRLWAGPGNDLLIGDSGNDVLVTGPGIDRAYGGPGRNIIDGHVEIASQP